MRTRLGKEVGSIRTDPAGWTYWAERNWYTDKPGFIVVAPSGARTDWYPDESDARAKVRDENEKWFA